MCGTAPKLHICHFTDNNNAPEQGLQSVELTGLEPASADPVTGDTLGQVPNTATRQPDHCLCRTRV
jgi:hypothetical protein